VNLDPVVVHAELRHTPILPETAAACGVAAPQTDNDALVDGATADERPQAVG
jgi:hypothetical protein